MNMEEYLGLLMDKVISLSNNTLEVAKIERYNLWQSLIKSHEYRHKLNRFGFQVYSQNDQDGIIDKLCEMLNIRNGSFVEFGCGDGISNNTRYLLLKNWQGLWIENDVERARFVRDKIQPTKSKLSFLCEKITTENINEIIEKYMLKMNIDDLDLMSIDTDWNDLYLLENQRINPKIIVIEYNSHFPPNISLSVPKNDNPVWDGSNYFGASLKAITDCAQNLRYTLIGCSIAGTDAFFVRNDLIDMVYNYVGKHGDIDIPKVFNHTIGQLYGSARFNLCFNLGHQSFIEDFINLDN